MGHQTTNSPSSAIERIYGVVPQGWPCAKKRSKMGRNGRDEGEAGGRMSRRRRVSESRRKRHADADNVLTTLQLPMDAGIEGS